MQSISAHEKIFKPASAYQKMDPFKKEKRNVIIMFAVIVVFIGIIVFALSGFNITTSSVKNIDDAKAKIDNNLEKSGEKVLILLDENSAKMRDGETLGIPFAIKNLEDEAVFSYSITAENEGTCYGPLGWITLGKSGSATIAQNSTFYGLIRIEAPSGTENCVAIFSLNVEKDSSEYENAVFRVNII